MRNEVKGENWGTLQFWGQTKQKAEEKRGNEPGEKARALEDVEKKGINCCRNVLEMERKEGYVQKITSTGRRNTSPAQRTFHYEWIWMRHFVIFQVEIITVMTLNSPSRTLWES